MRTLLGLSVLITCACSANHTLPAPPTPRSVSIDATATLHLPPDTAAIQLTFGAIEDDLGAAHLRVEHDRAAFLRDIERFEARVETGLIQYSRYRPNHATVDRHRASQSVIVHTSHFDDIPEIIGLAAEGLSAVSVRHYVADMVQHRTRLRAMAIEAANAKAEDLASGFGAELGRVLTIEEGGASTTARGVGNFDNNAMVRVGTPEGGSPPPGAIPLRVTLQLSFELLG